MLTYLKRYEILACVFGIAVPVITMYIWSFIAGQNMGFTAWGAGVSVVLLLISLFVFSRIMSAHAQKKLESLVSLYNDGCDAQAFVEQGAKIADSSQGDLDEVAGWYLSFYALALCDCGQRDKAANLGLNIKNSITNCESGPLKQALYADFIPLVARLFGPAQTVALTTEALNIATEGDDALDTRAQSYLMWARQVANAELTQDPSALLTLCQQVRESADQPMRLRVEFALQEGGAALKLGKRDRAQQCYRFAADNGNLLPSAQKAKAALAAL